MLKIPLAIWQKFPWLFGKNSLGYLAKIPLAIWQKFPWLFGKNSISF
jgi:hypothetical protein